MFEHIRKAWSTRWDGTTKFPKLDMSGLLNEALTEPGIISDVFSVFHNYSFANTMQVLYQCMVKDIEAGPMASESKWKAMGRTLKPEYNKSKLWIWIPRMVSKKNKETGEKESYFIGRFLFKPVVAVLSMTDGEEFIMPDPPTFSLPKALETLEIEIKDFKDLNGNVGGYAKKDGSIAVNPLSEYPFAVAIHEVTHQVLHKGHEKHEISKALREVEAEATTYLVCNAVEVMTDDMASKSRGYIQHWLKAYGSELTEQTSNRIFGAVNKILKAGV